MEVHTILSRVLNVFKPAGLPLTGVSRKRGRLSGEKYVFFLTSYLHQVERKPTQISFGQFGV